MSDTEPAILVKNIIGWDDYGLDAARNLDYHGTLTQVTKALGFTGSAKDYIEAEFKKNAVLGKITLIVERLLDEDGELKWLKDFPVYADFYKKEIQDDVLTISFNSNNLMDKIDAYEDEEVYLERLEDFQNNIMPLINERKVDLLGRSLIAIGESEVRKGYFEDVNGNQVTFTEDYNGSSTFWTVITDFVNQGPSRHSTVDIKDGNLTASRMLYVNSTTEDAINEVGVDYLLLGNYSITGGNVGQSYIDIVKYSYNEDTASYTELSRTSLFNNDSGNAIGTLNVQGVYTNNLKYNESLAIVFDKAIRVRFAVYRNIISEVAKFEPSYDINFYFISDVINRLLLIISGKQNLLKSSIFKLRENINELDGKYALIGMVSGIQARGFTSDLSGYKSPIISLKNALTSVSNNLSLGYGVELIDNKEQLVIEEIDYFYRQEIAGKFPKQITNVKRIVDEKHYYGSIELGFERGGNYVNRVGLDEPNLDSNFVTPIEKNNKFKKTSTIRGDETGLEIIRRKNYKDFPEENVNGEENNWFLDLKRSVVEGKEFEQVDWSDRLSELPTGIHSPETFRSMLFTPMRSLLRLAKNFKSGLYLYKEKFINFTSSKTTTQLQMKFIGEENYYTENSDVKIGDLNRPIFKNEIIQFTHPYSEDLRKLLFGKTKIIIDGEERIVPNFHFKFEWLNENEEIERGYFLKYEYEDNPTFEFQLANEEII
jgi:hypothetical protein